MGRSFKNLNQEQIIRYVQDEVDTLDNMIAMLENKKVRLRVKYNSYVDRKKRYDNTIIEYIDRARDIDLHGYNPKDYNTKESRANTKYIKELMKKYNVSNMHDYLISKASELEKKVKSLEEGEISNLSNKTKELVNRIEAVKDVRLRYKTKLDYAKSNELDKLYSKDTRIKNPNHLAYRHKEEGESYEDYYFSMKKEISESEAVENQKEKNKKYIKIEHAMHTKMKELYTNNQISNRVFETKSKANDHLIRVSIIKQAKNYQIYGDKPNELTIILYDDRMVQYGIYKVMYKKEE